MIQINYGQSLGLLFRSDNMWCDNWDLMKERCHQDQYVIFRILSAVIKGWFERWCSTSDRWGSLDAHQAIDKPFTILSSYTWNKTRQNKLRWFKKNMRNCQECSRLYTLWKWSYIDLLLTFFTFFITTLINFARTIIFQKIHYFL